MGKISNKSKSFLRMAALVGCLQAGCSTSSPFQKVQLPDEVQLQHTDSFLGGLSQEDQVFWKNFIDDYSQKSPTAKKMLADIFRQKARLELFTRQPNEENIFRAGESTENTLGINRLIHEKKVSLADTFFHEGEHVIHMKKAHQNGINARSFSSLNDVYVYATLLEALAYRKAAICCAEYEHKLSEAEIQKKANEVFEKRLLTKSHDPGVRFSYEKSAIIMTNAETNRLPRQVHFGKKVDWDKVVTLLSRSEVTKMPALPEPTLTFVGVCLLRELEKHPDARELKDLDISCVLTNKTSLQKDQLAIKTVVADHLIEIYDLCQKKGMRFSDDTRFVFLNLIGWPNKQQLEQIEHGRITFKKVRDFNLSKFKTEELFDAAQRLLQRPEIRAYNDPDVRHFEQILKFEKMILVPNRSQQKVKAGTKAR